MTPDQTTTPPTVEAIQPARLPYDAELFKQSEEFCSAVLRDIPELHGVAIIPIWTNNPEGTPPGLLRLRDPNAPYLASILRLLGRMAAFNVEVHKDFMAQLRVFDNYAAQLSEKIKEYTEHLEQLETPPNE